MAGTDTSGNPESKEVAFIATGPTRRLDQVLTDALEGAHSRARVKAMIEKGLVTVAGTIVKQPSFRLQPGARIRLRVEPPVAAKPAPQAIALDILYEDDEIIVVNKPAGLVVHPGAGNPDNTLVNALIHHCGASLSGIGGVSRPGIVHRLDKDTSGVMVVAKTDQAHRSLSAQFAAQGAEHELRRSYCAIIWGAPNSRHGRIEAPLGRSNTDRTRRQVVAPSRADARYAATSFEVVERFGQTADGLAIASRLHCRLETGRTHQIRVHLAHIGHPVIGDAVYGKGYFTKANTLPPSVGTFIRQFSRQALHAEELSFRHPATGRLLEFAASLPVDMIELIDQLRKL